MVDNEIDMDWLWVTAQKNKERGLVPVALVEDAVSLLMLCHINFSQLKDTLC